ncbi:THUMP domain-containing protein 1 [Galendromus occidentalis]|uniref:THUMP domain-containing protein 1 n=1 Tax=Galendromus occidentalis TaxID=34638 RepID=A0AAJ6QX65_9ACAR|nr:THUMP domain-containing protein 1 [Galendromus occidentalis]
MTAAVRRGGLIQLPTEFSSGGQQAKTEAGNEAYRSAMSSEPKRRKRSYYVASANKKRGNFLDCDVGRGFLVTINPKQERRATLTAYSLLNEAADRLYGPQKISEENKVDGDIEAELKSIREDGCRFKKLRTEIPANIFIRTTLEKPVDILSDVFERMPKNINYIHRFVAVLATCKTQPENISKKVLEILAENFSEGMETITFMVQLKARHNNEYKESAKRQDFCRKLAESIQEANSSFVPDLKDPSLVVNVDVLQKVCCISLLPHYKRFKKYNPEQFVEPLTEKPQDEKTATDLQEEGRSQLEQGSEEAIEASEKEIGVAIDSGEIGSEIKEQDK